MTDDELINEMKDAVKELRQQGDDMTLTAPELRLTIRLTAILIEKWETEIPAGD